MGHTGLPLALKHIEPSQSIHCVINDLTTWPVTHISRARKETQAVLQIFIFVFYVFLVSIFVNKDRFAGLFSSNILKMGAHGSQPGVRLLPRDMKCFDSNSCSVWGHGGPALAIDQWILYRPIICSVDHGQYAFTGVGVVFVLIATEPLQVLPFPVLHSLHCVHEIIINDIN
jgi:hypothetical protein